MCDESVILGELSMLGRRLWVAGVAEMLHIELCRAQAKAISFKYFVYRYIAIVMIVGHKI